MKLFCGIDTSNYTTSSAVCDEDGNVLLNKKLPLPVREGERGLRQSDAVFHHVKNLPEAARALNETLDGRRGDVCAVGCSYAPRDCEGSYMPCFLSGIAAAEYFAAAAGVPVYRTSHQAGHVMAALNSACVNSGVSRGGYMESEFIAFHVSGGTTDVLLCKPDEERIFSIERIGGTRDINGGQAIDRTGVTMGLRFPCGAEMDKAALSYNGKPVKVRTSVDGLFCNLSGLENSAAKVWNESGSIEKTSAYTLSFLADTLEKITQNALSVYGDLPVIYAGGVMSSRFIGKTLGKYGMFASPEFSSDNAAGCALLTAELFDRGIKPQLYGQR